MFWERFSSLNPVHCDDKFKNIVCVEEEIGKAVFESLSNLIQKYPYSHVFRSTQSVAIFRTPLATREWAFCLNRALWAFFISDRGVARWERTIALYGFSGPVDSKKLSSKRYQSQFRPFWSSSAGIDNYLQILYQQHW